jgi:acetoin utilization protein AcuB
MMIVRERMTSDPVTVSPEDTLATAHAKMEAGTFRQLPVVANEKVIGIITDRDIREHRRQMRITKVSEVMTENVLTITPKMPLADAAQILLKHKFGGLPVVAGEKLIGIITVTDFLRAFVDLTASSSSKDGAGSS